jgi:hypothetical protein
MAVDISKVNSLCDKIDTGITNIEDEGVKGVMTDIAAALRLINNNHEGIVKSQINRAVSNTVHQSASQSGSGMITLDNVSKKNRSEVQAQDNGSDCESVNGISSAGPPPPSTGTNGQEKKSVRRCGNSGMRLLVWKIPLWFST